MLDSLTYSTHGAMYIPVLRPDHTMLQIVLDLVHPGNLGALPPSPSLVAFKGQEIGVALYREFFRYI